MADEEKLEDVVLTGLLRLNAKVQAVVVGMLAGLAIFLATNWLVLKGGHIGPAGDPVVGPHLSLLNQFFVGYSVTFLGSLIGFAYGFVGGFLVAYFFARVYNLVVDFREKKSRTSA